MKKKIPGSQPQGLMLYPGMNPSNKLAYVFLKTWFTTGVQPIYTTCVMSVCHVASNRCLTINFMFWRDLRISVGDVLVGVRVANLFHGFGYPRFLATTKNVVLKVDLGVSRRSIFH